jgi:hypothetical protein
MTVIPTDRTRSQKTPGSVGFVLEDARGWASKQPLLHAIDLLTRAKVVTRVNDDSCQPCQLTRLTRVPAIAGIERGP